MGMNARNAKNEAGKHRPMVNAQSEMQFTSINEDLYLLLLRSTAVMLANFSSVDPT